MIESRPAPNGRPAARLDLKVGFSCNNRCVFCVQGDKRDRFPDRETDELIEILAERREVADAVVLTGGEASIRGDFVRLVRAASELGYERIQLQTNGRRLSYRPFARALAEAGLTEAVIAIHGSCPVVHDSLTRARGSFMQAVGGVRHLLSLGIPVVTNTVLVRDNIRDLPRLAEVLVGLRVVGAQLGFVHPAGTAETNFREVVPRLATTMPFVHAALDTFATASIVARTEAIPYCFMSGYETSILEGLFPDTYVVDAQLVVQSYNTYRQLSGKAKGPRCAHCTYDDRCEGPWREYPEAFGWDEFVPRTDAPRDEAASDR